MLSKCRVRPTHRLLGRLEGNWCVGRTLRFNAIKLSQGEHAGSPLQPRKTWGLVGADLRVSP